MLATTLGESKAPTTLEEALAPIRALAPFPSSRSPYERFDIQVWVEAGERSFWFCWTTRDAIAEARTARDALIAVGITSQIVEWSKSPQAVVS